MCQIFWNVIAWDLVMNVLFVNADKQAEDGSFRILTIVSTAFITSITCLGCGIGCRFIFRLGNGWIDEIMNPEHDLSPALNKYAANCTDAPGATGISMARALGHHGPQGLHEVRLKAARVQGGAQVGSDR